MAYNPAIPAATNRLKDSQGDIMNNFSEIYSWVAKNHTQFDTSGPGRHQFIELPTGTPVGVTNINTPEVALYSKNGATSGDPELYFQRNNLGADMGYAITEAVNATNGWTRLPSGIILAWGSTSGGAMNGNAWNLVNFPTAFPNNCFNVSVTSKTVHSQPSDAETTCLMLIDPTFNKTRFYVFNRRTDAGGGINSDICWFAIGN